MYDSFPNSSEEETNSLLPRASNSRKNTGTPASKKGLMINRVMIILLLAGLVGVSITLQSFQAQLNDQLSTDEAKIKTLEATVLAQGKIIERFNESVTNTDVIDELHAMEILWDHDRTNLFEQLNQTKAAVHIELDKTMSELDKVVRQAENEIHEQVDTVKKNFDQYVIKTEDRFSVENDFMIYQVAGTFTVLSCLISMWHMGSHTRKMEQPAIQRKILAILWMCPIYAVSSCLSLVFDQYTGYFAIVKDFYESYIIYQFLSFCISAIGGGDREKVIDALAKEVGHLTPPFRLFFCCKREYEDDRVLAGAILLQCQAFAMQFVFWKPVTAIATFALKRYDYYGPFATDSMDWKSIQFWISIIVNLSTAVAFAGLLKFYHAVDADLAWCRPFAKFLCIKGVVFMTFWQGMALKIMAETTDVGGGGETADQWSEQVQNFLICLEMLLFSIAHFYCFPVDEWQPGYKVNYRKAKFGETMALNDFFTDLKIILSNGGHNKKKRSKKPSESTIEEEDDASETQDGSIRSDFGSSVDEEDPKDSLVRVLRDYDDGTDDNERNERNDSTENRDSVYTEEHFASMLDEMLIFSPQKGSRTVDKLGSDENDDAQSHHTDENANTDFEHPRKTTGLLTGESPTTLTSNLKPSIFTTISQHQSKEEEEVAEAVDRTENEERNSEEDSEQVSEQGEKSETPTD